jgi:formylglycine-generating enzyme required for sulfatase activity
MKSPRIVVCGIAVLVFLLATKSQSADPEKPAKPAADAMIGKEAGQVRDDNGLKMKLIWCLPAKFTMGSPSSEPDRDEDENRVSVSLTKRFWLGKYEVTQSEWKSVMKTEPWKGQGSTKGGADFPATFVSWNDVMVFCRKLTEQERQARHLSEDWEYTLPTEAQWERACRAQAVTSFSFGADESKLRDYAWFGENALLAGEEYAHRVGLKKANAWGFCDMHGNVWEWCRDIYTEKLPGGSDPEVKRDENAGDTIRVHRGGGWYGTPQSRCRIEQAVRSGLSCRPLFRSMSQADRSRERMPAEASR